MFLKNRNYTYTRNSNTIQACCHFYSTPMHDTRPATNAKAVFQERQSLEPRECVHLAKGSDLLTVVQAAGAGRCACWGLGAGDRRPREPGSACSRGREPLLLIRWGVAALARAAGGWIPILSCNHTLSKTLPKFQGRGSRLSPKLKAIKLWFQEIIR